MLQPPHDELDERDYRYLLAVRSAIARFTRRGEERAQQLGLTHAQHHLLLAVRAHPAGPPGIVDVAAHLALRANSAAELVNRAVAGGYLERPRDTVNRRRVHLQLTANGADRLAALTHDQLADLSDLITTLSANGADQKKQGG